MTDVTNTDVEAWSLARDAFRACGLDPAGASAVYVGERAENGHQMIYAV